jgi:4,5:9,10-diseco-3-hydroxy-5,9,17-trioxoandrosta-1(10),2-diene-4-oate hydrolase
MTSSSALHERLVPAGDIRLHVTEIGEGPALVWLHGAGPGATGMSNFRQNLPAFADRRNLVFDLPRFGRSDAPVLSLEAGEFFAPYAAAAVAEALDALGVERCSVIGNSMGGATALKLAADHPELVDRLVLMAPAGTAPPDWDGGVPPGLMKIAEWMWNGPSEQLIREFAELQVHDPSLLTDTLLAERLRGASDPDVVATNPVTNGLPGDLNGDLPNVLAPTLLLWGREDVFIPLEWGLHALRGLPDAELRVLPACGHWVQFEHADRFDRIVTEFLEEGRA